MRPIQPAKFVVLPHGSRRAIKVALDVAISALAGEPFNPVPAARPRMRARLIKARTALLQARIVSP